MVRLQKEWIQWCNICLFQWVLRHWRGLVRKRNKNRMCMRMGVLSLVKRIRRIVPVRKTSQYNLEIVVVIKRNRWRGDRSMSIYQIQIYIKMIFVCRRMMKEQWQGISNSSINIQYCLYQNNLKKQNHNKKVPLAVQ